MAKNWKRPSSGKAFELIPVQVKEKGFALLDTYRLSRPQIQGTITRIPNEANFSLYEKILFGFGASPKTEQYFFIHVFTGFAERTIE